MKARTGENTVKVVKDAEEETEENDGNMLDMLGDDIDGEKSSEEEDEEEAKFGLSGDFIERAKHFFAMA